MSNASVPQRPSASFLWVGSAAVVVFVGLRLGAPLLVPLACAALLVIATAPITAFCVRRGLSPGLGAAAGVLVNILLLSGMATLLGVGSVELQHEAARYLARLDDGLAALRIFLASHHLPADRALDSINELARSALQEGLFSAASSIEGIGVVLLLLFFGLSESASIGNKLRRIFPNERHEFPEVDRLIREVQGYLLVKLLTSSLAAVCAWAILHLAGVGLAVPLALVMFVLHFVPNVGPLLAMLPAALVAYVDRGVGGMLAVGLGYVAVTLAIGNLLEPRILGRTLGLSPFAVVLALFAWAFLWGPVGALLAVPLTSVLKLVLEGSTAARWAILLEDPAHVNALDADSARLKRQLKLPWRHGTGSPLGLGSGDTGKRPTPPVAPSSP
ncbi:MAG: AI-2E family transporter [Polyangiales bacterium]